MSKSSKQKIRIGESPYTYHQLKWCRQGVNLYEMVKQGKYLIPIIEAYQAEGYEVKFEQRFLDRIFSGGNYIITAYKDIPEETSL